MYSSNSRLSSINDERLDQLQLEINRLQNLNLKLDSENQELAEKYKTLTLYNQTLGNELANTDTQIYILEQSIAQNTIESQELTQKNGVLQKDVTASVVRLQNNQELINKVKDIHLLLKKRRKIARSLAAFNSIDGHPDGLPLLQALNVLKRKINVLKSNNKLLDEQLAVSKLILDGSLSQKEKNEKLIYLITQKEKEVYEKNEEINTYSQKDKKDQNKKPYEFDNDSLAEVLNDIYQSSKPIFESLSDDFESYKPILKNRKIKKSEVIDSNFDNTNPKDELKSNDKKSKRSNKKKRQNNINETVQNSISDLFPAKEKKRRRNRNKTNKEGDESNSSPDRNLDNQNQNESQTNNLDNNDENNNNEQFQNKSFLDDTKLENDLTVNQITNKEDNQGDTKMSIGVIEKETKIEEDKKANNNIDKETNNNDKEINDDNDKETNNNDKEVNNDNDKETNNNDKEVNNGNDTETNNNDNEVNNKNDKETNNNNDKGTNNNNDNEVNNKNDKEINNNDNNVNEVNNNKEKGDNEENDKDTNNNIDNEVHNENGKEANNENEKEIQYENGKDAKDENDNSLKQVPNDKEENINTAQKHSDSNSGEDNINKKSNDETETIKIRAPQESPSTRSHRRVISSSPKEIELLKQLEQLQVDIGRCLKEKEDLFALLQKLKNENEIQKRKMEEEDDEIETNIIEKEIVNDNQANILVSNHVETSNIGNQTKIDQVYIDKEKKRLNEIKKEYEKQRQLENEVKEKQNQIISLKVQINNNKKEAKKKDKQLEIIKKDLNAYKEQNQINDDESMDSTGSSQIQIYTPSGGVKKLNISSNSYANLTLSLNQKNKEEILQDLYRQNDILKKSLADMDYRERPQIQKLIEEVNSAKDKVKQAKEKLEQLNQELETLREEFCESRRLPERDQFIEMELTKLKFERRLSKWRTLFYNCGQTIQAIENFSNKNNGKRDSLVETLEKEQRATRENDKKIQDLEDYSILLDVILTEYRTHWANVD